MSRNPSGKELVSASPTNADYLVFVLDSDGTYRKVALADFLNRAPLSLTSATAVTRAGYAGRSTVLSNATGFAVTLPAATGSGDRYNFIIGTTVTSGSMTIKVANSSDAFQGFSMVVSDDAGGPVKGFIAAAGTDDTVTLNGTTTGGYVGDVISFIDIAANRFQVEVRGKATGTEATPFSATV